MVDNNMLQAEAAFSCVIARILGEVPLQHLVLDRLEDREAELFAEMLKAYGIRGTVITPTGQVCSFTVWEAKYQGEPMCGWLITGPGISRRGVRQTTKGFRTDLLRALNLPA